MIALVTLWTLYYALHSAFASLWVKNVIREKMPSVFGAYRLLYNLLALLLFILIVSYQISLPSNPISALPGWIEISGYFLTAVGLIIIGATFIKYDAREFIGFKKMNEFDPANRQLIISGLNTYVRHPIYSGTILALAGYLMVSFDYRTLAFCVVSLLYIFIGANIEEKKLIALYGDHYRTYKKNVGMFFPSFKKERRLGNPR